MRRSRDLPAGARDALGSLALVASTLVALPLTRWGDSSFVLVVVPAVIAAYWAGRWMTSFALAAACFVAAVLVSVPIAYVVPGGGPMDILAATVPGAFFTAVVPWWIGRYRLLRAEQRERDSAVVAERAQAEERARIADDLHDTLGHELALIAVQAGALELDPGLDQERRRRFGELREAAVRASARLREVVELTRRPDAPARLDPIGLALDAVVDRARAAGMPVQLVREGNAGRPPAPAIQETLLRVVREGLTNAARHAPGASVEVHVTELPESIEVRVVNAAGDAPAGDAAGSRHGIPSLRERTALVGGTVTAEPRADGGFELVATLPRAWSPPPAQREAAFAANARKTRRRILQATIAPLVVASGIVLAFAGLQIVTYVQTALPEAVYHAIELGQSRAELDRFLPNGIPAPPPVVDDPAAPEGTRCEYFAAREIWLHFTDDTYRLCFDDDVLVEKRLLERS